jgi:energy-coupling factor transporter transmembrane protein EcfT
MFIAPIQSVWVLVGGTGLGLSVVGRVMAPDKVFECPVIIRIALAGLVAFHLMAIPGSIWWGSGNWELTASAVFWMVPSAALLWVTDKRVFPWLIIFALAHSGAVMIDGFTQWTESGSQIIREGLPAGLTFNPNVAAGFLVFVGSICIWNGYPRWLLMLMLLAVFFTNSRWAIMVLGSLTTLAFITGRLEWRWLLYAVIVLACGVFAVGFVTPYGYHIAGYHSFSPGSLLLILGDLGNRLEIPVWPDFLPRGVLEHRGMHNVPLRMAREAGAIAAVLWVAISGWALTRQKFSVWWWLMVTVLLLSLLDHYTFRPHLGGMWWLAMGGMLNRMNLRCSTTLRYDFAALVRSFRNGLVIALFRAAPPGVPCELERR